MNTSVHCLADSDLQVERMVRNLRIQGFQDISVFYPDPERRGTARVGFPCAPAAHTSARGGNLDGSKAPDPAPPLPFPADSVPFADRHALLGGGVLPTLRGMGIAAVPAKAFADRICEGFALILVHVPEATDGERQPGFFDAADATDLV